MRRGPGAGDGFGKEQVRGPHRGCPHGCTSSLEATGQLTGQFDKKTRAEGKSGPEQIWGRGRGRV